MNTPPLLDLLSHIALKGAAVLLVALLLGLVLRRMAAARRYALWLTAVATLAVLPLAMWALPAWHVLPQASTELDWPLPEPELPMSDAAPALPPEDLSPILPPAGHAVPLPVQAPVSPAPSWDISWQDVVAVLPLVWVSIAGLLLLRLGLSAWRLRRLEASLRPGECPMLEQAARELGLKRLPRLLIGPADAVPMVWGVLRPRRLLPEGFAEWSHEKQRGVLLHELAHLRRGDPLALWAAQWVKALHWFNPLAWFTLRLLRADQERACDDTVLRQGVRASDYAQSLLDLSRHTRLAPGLSLCALTITRCAPVEARVKDILDPQRHREPLTLRWVAGLAGCALLISLPVAMLQAIEGPALRGRILDRHGVVLAESTPVKERVYPLKTLAAHVIGYSRRADADHPHIFGGAGLEKQQDASLSAGKDVTLTLDMRLQSLALRAMKEGGVERGAAVVLDPRTGEILAMVSLPSFDPNVFIPSITEENWKKHLSDPDVPLLNRCVKGHGPGAPFTLLTGLAGGAAGISGQKFNCTGSVSYGGKAMECWLQRRDGNGHGMLGLSDALVAGCGCYWYQLGNAVGIEEIESMGRQIGFGSAYGITEDESPGVLSSPAWLAQHRPQEKWSEGYTAVAATGHGFMLATPLQMAVLAATVGNGGKVPQPAMLKSAAPSSWRADLTQGTLTAADVEPLREGMRLVVNSTTGTGKPARSDKVVIAGKTGTVQNWRLDANRNKVDDNLGWFIGFAPFDKPQLAFAILKNEANGGGKDCGPIVKRIVEEALALPADGSGEVKPVDDDAGRNHGELKKTASAEEPSTKLSSSHETQMRQQSDAAIRMRPALARTWALLKRTGMLADLPAETQPFDLGENRAERQMPSVTIFHFLAPREAVRRWLADSHCRPINMNPAAAQHATIGSALTSQTVNDGSLDWPARPEIFMRIYSAAGHCEISIHGSDAENVRVSIYQRRHSMLIAPDESQQPRPAGRLEPEYHGKGFTQHEAPPPAWDTALSTLLPTVSPHGEKPPRGFLTPPVHYHFQVQAPDSYADDIMPIPVDSHLQGQLSADSKKALLRSSSVLGKRAQQSLVVRLPLTR